ncbi:MAG: AAA family ATPase [candidate division WOR-3 bacterium]
MKIKTLKVKGFRGFLKESEFDFAPVTILFGPNGTGKSSTLNAIEWCLWGRKCMGKDTGIRERIDWEIKNRYTMENPFVEINFDHGEKISRKYISDKKDDPYMTETINGLLNKYSFNDFFVGVYQHQEVIRAILTQEPKDRNEGFDRLFGLSDYRNIIDFINETIKKKGGLEELVKEVEREISKFKDDIKNKIDVWTIEIDKLEQELKNKGVKESDFTKEGEDKYKKEILENLKKFIEKLSLQPSDEFQKMQLDEKTERFVRVIKSEITRLRSEMPDVKKQNELFQKRSKLNSLFEEYKESNRKFKDKKEELEKFIKEKGSREEIKNRINKLSEEISKIEKEKEQKSLKGSTIEKAIEYLRKEEVDKNICPVCGKETKDLLEHLEKEWKEKYSFQLEELNKKLESLQNEKKNMEELIKKMEEMEWDIEMVNKNLKEKIKSIGEELKREIKEDEDPGAILKRELEGIERELERVKKDVEEKQKELNNFEEKLTFIDKLREYLEKVGFRERAREIEKTEEWKKMNEKKEELIKLKERINSIISAIKKASQKEAQTKIENAIKRINEYFNKITNHPKIKNLKLEVKEDKKTGGNNYEIKDENNNPVTSILSQGNMNALALSIFLALCENMPFEFIMLDDPSQSLSSNEKKNFVEILNNITEKKQVIISTMDNELFEYLKNLQKQKKIYKFENWDLENGPYVNEE